MKAKMNKQKKLKKKKQRERKHASSDERQGEIGLNCWCSPDFFLHLSLAFSQLQVIMSSSWKTKAPCWLILQVFLAPAVGGGLGSVFLFQLFGKEGGSVWATVTTVAQFPAQALRAVCAAHSLQLCWAGADKPPCFASLWSILRWAEWGQIAPTILLPCWLGSCTRGMCPAS